MSSPPAGVVVNAGELLMENRVAPPVPSPVVGAVAANGNFENWEESAMADTSQKTDNSTDVETHEKN
ncbi:hypothetical protein Dimus_001616 [Dionaea muscipula]